MSIMDGFTPRGEVAADDRSRIAFGRVGVKRHDRYLVAVNDRGEIFMVPMASIPRRELIVWERPDVLASLMRGMDDAAHGRVRSRDDFLGEDASG